MGHIGLFDIQFHSNLIFSSDLYITLVQALNMVSNFIYIVTELDIRVLLELFVEFIIPVLRHCFKNNADKNKKNLAEFVMGLAAFGTR
jgi:hypothetical protein